MEEKRATLSVFVNKEGDIQMEVSTNGFNTLEILGLKTFFEEAYDNLIDMSDE